LEKKLFYLEQLEASITEIQIKKLSLFGF